MQQAPRLTTALACGLAIIAACESPSEPNLQFATIEVDAIACAYGQTFTLASQNQYFPIAPVRREWEFAGKERADQVELTITVLDSTKVVNGVTTRVIREVEVVNGDTVEISYNFFAETLTGTVCYFGEDVTIFLPEGGTSNAGAWLAVGGNVPGIIMPAGPRAGMRFKMEGAAGVAEDEGRIAGGGRVKVGAGTFDATLRVREFNPLDGDVGFKTFAPGVGMVIDGSVELVSCTHNCPAGT